MPTYDYECTVCKKTFEHDASIHSDALTVAPGCTAPNCKVRRVLTGFTGIMKGKSGAATSPKEAPAVSDKPAYLSADPVHTCSKYCSHH